MSINKISIIQALRNRNYNYLSLEHVIVILLDNTVSIRQARRYLYEKFPERNIDWSACQDSEIEKMATEAQLYSKEKYQIWKQEYRRYLDTKELINKKLPKLMEKLEIRVSQVKESFEILKVKLQELKIQVLNNKKSDLNYEVQQLIKEIQEVINLSIQKDGYQSKRVEFKYQNDCDFQKIIKEIMQKLQLSQIKKEDYEIQVEKKIVTQALEEYDRKLLKIKKRLYQIFLYYCRQHKAVGATFEQFGKYSQLIDLRIFLKYFKDYEFVQYNKFRFKIGTVTFLFKNQAKNGLTLNFQQFWNLHKKLFQMQSIEFTRQNINKAERSQLQKMKNKWDEQLAKLNQFNEIANETKTKQLFTFINLRTEESPDQKIFRKNPSSIITSKVSSNNSSKYYQKSSFSQKKPYDLSLKKYFIQQVRAEMNNAESTKSLGVKMIRKDSESNTFPSLRKKAVEGSLPKILKISTEQISNQGIYQSLKHFANYDYIIQERKIKDIIGLSNGEDDDYIGAYLKREVTVKQEKKKERSIQRQQKRKKLLQNLTKKQQHCKRYHAHEVQPYMRF